MYIVAFLYTNIMTPEGKFIKEKHTLTQSRKLALLKILFIMSFLYVHINWLYVQC